MAMNAHAQALVGLITSANLRFVIPVYQRPYSWDEEQCEQLWDDILYVGGRSQDRHFTGSVVWVQDGTFSASGIQPMLLIDGQQRITTLTLIIAALAEYARNHPEDNLHFSFNEIMQRGYLVDTFRRGEDRYKLTLTRGDRKTLQSIVENLVDPDTPLDTSSSRLIDNFQFFLNRIEALESPDIVWDGIQRLDVVSISLDANQDNPQLIFESMNSTGKDLSSADLVRNYVLMGLPKEKQDALYLNHWRNIETTLGSDSYENIFDEFLRNYLTVLYAPEPLAKRDIYSIFKRHVVNEGYDRDDRMVDLLKEMERFASYYANIMNSQEENGARRAVFNSLRKLDVTVVNPLLMSLYDDYEQGAFDDMAFERMLKLVESYVFRRSVCDVATNSLNKFLPSVIAKLNKIQDENGDYEKAFEAFFMLEAGTARRFPDNPEFFNALTTRDAYHYRRAFYLLSNLENTHHTKDPLDLTPGTFSIEHVMPQNALASNGWVKETADLDEESFASLVNNLGNLTLTAYNSELSDDSFSCKKDRYVGGYGKDYLVISDAMRKSETWGETQIQERARELAKSAEARWGYLSITSEEAQRYAPKKPEGQAGRSAVFKNIYDAGLIHTGDTLFPKRDKYNTKAVINESGLIELPNGETFKSPSLAAKRVVALSGGAGARNGWHFWRVGEHGPYLDELRSEYILANVSTASDISSFRIAFWEGFYDFCANSNGFTDYFNDPSNRPENSGSWASFGIGLPDMHISALLSVYPKFYGAELWCDNADAYMKVLKLQNAFHEQYVCPSECTIEWDNAEESKKTRHLVAKVEGDYEGKDWESIYQWMVDWFYRLRALAMEASN